MAKRQSNQPINDQIRYPKVRLIAEDGEMVGIVPIEIARQRAEQAGLDLVLISPNPTNPVCRIMDFGKYQFEQAKREREARKKQKTIEVKEVGLKLTTEEHDLSFKLKNAVRFLEEGNRVKVNIRFRGREMAYTNRGYDVMREFAERVKPVATVDRPARMEGRNMVMFLAPIKDN
ncbi:MAG: translation initiation factor IF-3 [Oscillospiraceae bacterium]|nr:translation initiation factor IF-3 [Oscillospiraceae bacterium]MDD4368564.1 translation initiation factor IF-3 [Oscillospiraceae bacterium]